MSNDTWTHAMARAVVRPLIGSGVTPNQLTTLRLLTGLAACLCLALRTRHAPIWGGALWLLSCFLDRADGELARIGNMMSVGGHRYDYLVDNGVNALFFFAIGVGLRGARLFGHTLGPWTIALGLLAGGAMLLCNWMSEIYERRVRNERIWNGAWGFHPDDALYLLGPAAWLGWLLPILLGGAAGASLMAVIIAVRLRHLLLRQGVTDLALPNSALPNSALPNSALPNSALPDSALPDSALPNAANSVLSR